MMGKNHVRSSFVIGITIFSVCGAVLPVNEMSESKSSLVSLNQFVQLFYPDSIYQKSLFLIVGWTFLLCGAFCIGTLLPDIDKDNSELGRYFHLPLKHRGWTHCWLPCLLLLLLSMVSPLCFVLWCGYILHIVEDSVSAAGIAFWYPFQKYKTYSSGAMVAEGHKVKLYYAGKPSETWTVVAIFVLCMLIIGWTGIYLHGFTTIWSVLTGR